MSSKNIIPKPKGLPGALGFPVDLVRGLASLAEIADHTKAMRESTAEMAKATRTLPDIDKELEEVAKGVSTLPEIEKRVTGIEQTMERMLGAVEELADGMSKLDETLGPLQESTARLARVVPRLPRRNRMDDDDA